MSMESCTHTHHLTFIENTDGRASADSTVAAPPASLRTSVACPLLPICHLTSTSKGLTWCAAEPPIQSEAMHTVTAHCSRSRWTQHSNTWAFLSTTTDLQRDMSSVLAIHVQQKSGVAKPWLAGTHKSGKVTPGQRTRVKQAARLCPTERATSDST